VVRYNPELLLTASNPDSEDGWLMVDRAISPSGRGGTFHGELLSRKGVRIERIVSTGQSLPAGESYNQEYDEWVLLVSGSAGLWIEGMANVTFVRATMS
jgi:hypothetical protein